MSRVELTRRADVDLQQIWVYIAEDNIAAADRLWEQLQSAIHLLSLNPYMGEAVGLRLVEIRQFSIRNYVMYFRPLPDGIRLLRVIHASRDVRALIDELDEGEL